MNLEISSSNGMELTKANLAIAVFMLISVTSLTILALPKNSLVTLP
jgi:hypothetical protein